MLRLVLLLTCLLAPAAALAEADGVDSRQEFPPLGCGNSVTGEEAGCHVQNANPALMVTIDGPQQIDVGEEGFGLYTASIPVGFMGLEGAGINVALDAPNAPGCELEGFAPSTKIGFPVDEGPPVTAVLSHKYNGEPPPTTLVGVWSYQFLVLNCDIPGPVLLRVAMNAFDGSGDETGEVWNSSTLDVTVPEPGAALASAAAFAAVGAIGARRR
jgi:hypothetical protein